jgi:ABC-type phosphate transport system permease subunit
MTAVQPMLMSNDLIYGFSTMMAGCMEGDPLYYIAWFFADLTEGSFIAALPASIGMIIMLLALALVAIPGGIFSAGFVAEYQNADLRKIERGVRSTSHHTEETSNEIKEQDEARSVK